MPNNRLARSLRTLRDQVLEKYPDAEWNGHGDPDGLNIIRAIEFSGDAADYLKRVLIQTEDSRISSVDRRGDKVVVKVVAARGADNGDPFPLDAAEALADHADSERAKSTKTPAKPKDDK